MTHQDAGEFFRRLDLLRELFDATVSETKATLYFEALKDLPLEAVMRGLNEAAKGCTFMPRPAEIRSLAVGDDEDHAERAWMVLRRAMSSIGSYASVSIADAALGETIVAMFGSWPAACVQDLSPEMWASRRKEFGRVYHVLRSRSLSGARYLAGLCEKENAGRADGMNFVPIVLIDGQTQKQLSAREADVIRQQFVAQTPREFAQLSDVNPGVLRLGETA